MSQEVSKDEVLMFFSTNHSLTPSEPSGFGKIHSIIITHVLTKERSLNL